MKLVISYWRYKTYDGKDRFIGGIETYIYHLGQLALEMGILPVVYQCASRDFKDICDGIEIYGIKTPSVTNCYNTRHCLYTKAWENIDKGKDILLFGGDQWSVPTKYKKAISIQHGIGWDVPIQYMTKFKCLTKGIGEQLKRLQQRRRWLAFFDNCINRVCVDYNFLNWYRTYETIKEKDNIWVIPNFSDVSDREEIDIKLTRQHKDINVIFARRFEDFRGVRLMASVADILINKYNNIFVTFAGMGERKTWLEEKFSTTPNVKITKYLPGESLNYHKKYDIAIVPSLGSEGTALSVIEALAAGCAVIATNVGGITNIILSGYNGILVNPTEIDLLHAIEEVVTNNNLRRSLAKNGYDTVVNAFSLDIWKNKWRKVLLKLAE